MYMDLVQLDVNAPYYRLNKIVYSTVKKNRESRALFN